MRYLYSWFYHTQAHHADEFNKPKAKPFPEELFCLATRCTTFTTHATSWALRQPCIKQCASIAQPQQSALPNPLDSDMDSERCRPKQERYTHDFLQRDITHQARHGDKVMYHTSGA